MRIGKRTYKRLTDAEKETISSLRLQGLTLQEISNRTNRVISVCWQYSLPSTKPPVS